MFYICEKNSTLLEKIVAEISIPFDNLATDERPELGSDITYKVIMSRNDYLKHGDFINIHMNNLKPVGNSLEHAINCFVVRYNNK